MVVKVYFMRQGVHSLCFEFKHLVYTNRAIQSKASFKGYNVYFRPDFPWEPSVLVSGHACHLHSQLSGQDLQASLKASSHGATVSDTTQSGPQPLAIRIKML